MQQNGTGNIAIGYMAQNTAGADAVVLGAFSKSDWHLNAGQQGYAPWEGSNTGNVNNSTFKNSLSSAAWKSTKGGLSIGDITGDKSAWITRQISGVAAGTQDTDAVNVAQLKASMTTLSSTDGSVKITPKYNDDGSRTFDLSASGGSGSGSSGHFVSVTKNNTSDSDDSLKNAGNYNNDGASGIQSTAVGVNAQAQTQGTALGNGAKASNTGATAIGSGAVANGTSSVALGQNASAQNDNAVAIGHGSGAYANSVSIGGNARSTAERSVHIGAMSDSNTTTGSASVSIGADAKATASGAASLGTGAVASGTDSLALGQNSSSTGNGSVAIGYQTKVTSNKEHATAVGTSAEANATEGTVLGYNAKVNGDKGVALGSGASVAAENGNKTSVALGAGSQVNNGDTVGTSSLSIKDTYGETSDSTTYNFAGANPTGTISVGSGSGSSEQTRTITHVAAGRVSSTSTDAINGSQLYGVAQSIEKVEQNVAKTATRYYSVNATDTGTGSNYLNDGAHGLNSLAAGNKAQAYGVGSLAIGYSSLAGSASNDNTLFSSMAIGPYAKAQGTGAIAFGNSSSSSGYGGVALGGGANVSSYGGVALGGTTSATATGGVALGTGSKASTAAGLAGYLSGSKKAGQADSVWTSTIGAVSLGGGTFKTDSGEKIYTRQITNLAAGTQDTDAVNVAQLKAVEQEGLSLTGNDGSKVTQSLGGNFNITGGLTGDALKDEVASTANLGVRKNAKGDGLEVVMTTTPSFDSVTAKNSITIKNASTADGTSDISLNGNGLFMGSKKITGLAAGTADTDAVNFGQLSKVSNELTAFENKTIQVGGNGGGTISRKLGENPILIQGAGTKDNANYSGTNLKTYVDENGVLQIMLDKELLEDRIDVGSALANPTDSRVNYPVVLGTDATDATIGYVGINGRNGTSAVITSYAGSPIPGSDFNYTDSEGKSRMTRLEYTDQEGHAHHLATLTDGLTFGGDNSQVQIDSDSGTVSGTNVISRKLRATEYGKNNTTTNYLQIKGGADADKLSDSNIGVQASSDDGSLTIKLSQELKNLTSAQFGTTTINGSGLTLGNTGISLTSSGLNNGGQKITNVAAGTISSTSTDAVIGSQLTNVLNADGSAKGISFGADSAAGSHTNPTSVAIGGTVTLKGAGGDSSHKNLSTQVTDKGVLTVTMAPEIQENKIYIGTQIPKASSPTGDVNYPVILGENTVGTDTYGYVGIKGKNNSQLYLTADKDTSNNTRLDYLDANNNAHLVALTSDGYTFAGDTGTANTLALNSPLSITGGIKDTGNLTTGNIGVVSSGNGGLTVQLAKSLTGLTDATFNSGAAQTKIDASGVTATAYKVGTKTYIDSQGLYANGQKVTVVQAGNLSADSTDAVNGSQLFATNQNVTKNADDITTLTTRLNGAGMTFAGDSGSTTVTLNGTLHVNGADSNLTVTGDTGGLTLGLAKNLMGLTGLNVVGSDFTLSVTGDGLAISPVETGDGKQPLRFSATEGVDLGNRKITDLAAGTIGPGSTEAVNGSQLYTVQEAASQAQAEAQKHTTVSVGDNNLVLTPTAESNTAGADYSLKLNNKITLGTGDNQVVLDGSDTGTSSFGKQITLNGDTGAVGVTSLTANGAVSAPSVTVGDIILHSAADSTANPKVMKDTITGLGNTTYDEKNLVSNRAATEGQLQSLVSQINAGKISAGSTNVVGSSNISISDSTSGKVTTYTASLTPALTGLTSAVFTNGKTGQDEETNTLTSDGLSLGKDIGAARFTRSGISAGSQQVKNLGSGITGTDGTVTTYDTTVTGQADYNNAASIGDVHKLVQEKAGVGTNITGNNSTQASLTLGGTISFKGAEVPLEATESLTDKLTNDYSSANVATQVSGSEGNVITTLYLKKDLVGRSLTLGTIGSDGNVANRDRTASLYQAQDDTAMVGHLFLAGEKRTKTAGNPTITHTSVDLYVKDGAEGDKGDLKHPELPVTRVYYTDEGNETYALATMKDGFHVAGDSGTASDLFLNQKLTLQGNGTAQTDYTSGNIGIYSEGNGTLDVQLKDTLTDLKNISFADSAVSIGQTGIHAGGKAIGGVLAGTEETDAVNVKQLGEAKAAASAEVKAGKNVTVSKDTTSAKDGHTIYTVAADFKGADMSGSNAVVYDSGTKTQVTLGGSTSATPVKLTNLAYGTISSTSTDAVTGKQLYDVIAYRDQTIDVAGDTGSAVKLNHGNTLNIYGDPNISTSSSGSDTAKDGSLQVSLADNVYLQGIHIGSSYPTHSDTSVDSVALTADANNQTGILTLRGDATHVSDAYPRAQADISVLSAAPGQTYMAAPFLQEVYQTSSSGSTTKNQPVRLAYRDNYNTAHQVATLDDGYVFSGDNGDKNLTEKLNGTVALRGMDNEHASKVTSDNADTYLTKNNIGVVTKPKSLTEGGSTQDGEVEIRLAKNLTGLTSATFTNDNGDTAVIDAQNLKLTLNAQTEGKSPVSLTSNGLDNGRNKITNVEAGTSDLDAVNYGQIKSIINSGDGKIKGLTFAAGDNTSATVHLGDTLKIAGATDTDGAQNIHTTIKDDGTLTLQLDRKVQVDELHVGQKNSDVASLTAVPLDGNAGSIGQLYLKGIKGAQAAVFTTMGAPSLDSTNQNTTTRLVYSNGMAGNIQHEIATLEDGLKFTGDNYTAASGDKAEQNVVKTQLDQTLPITGGQTDTQQLTDLTDKNIGVVAENGGLSVRLSKVLDGMTDIYMGDTRENSSHLTKNGLYLSPKSSTEYLAKFTADDGISAGSQTISNVANGVNDSDAATYGQLKDVAAKANNATKLTVNHNQPNGSLTLTDTPDADGIHHTYDVALSNTVTVGSAGNSITLDGTANTINGGSYVKFGGDAASKTQTLAIGWQSAGLKDVLTDQDKGSQTGNYLTGLSNTSWDPMNVGYSPNRAATEGQLRDLEKQVWENPITFLGNHDIDKTADESKGIKAELGSNVRIIGTGTGKDADFDASNINVIAGQTPDGQSEAMIIQMKKAPSFTTVHAGTPDEQGVYPVSVGQVTVTRDGKTQTVDGLVITDGPMITKDGINNYGKQITHMKSGGIYNEEDKKYHYDSDEVGTNAATIQDVKNIANAAAQSEVEGKRVTVSGVNDNITVTTAADNPNHYQVKLSDTLKLGQDSKDNANIIIDGQKGKVTVGSGSTGNNSVIIDGNGGTVTIGNGTSGHQKVVVDGNNGTITGLTNKDWDGQNIVSGRAATEDQLKKVADSVGNLDKAASKTDFQLVGEKDKDGNYTGDYEVSDDNKVKLHVQDKMHPDQVKDITIDNVAKASDIGDVSQISEDIQNKEHNTVVDSLNKLNEKVKDAANGSWESQIDGKAVKKIKAGDVQNFTSGDNIQLSDDNGAIKISTKKDVSFDKVTIGSGDSQMTLDKDGLQTGKVKVSSSEINAGGNQIHGVADGTEKDDAATVGQVDTKVNEVDTKVDKVADAAGTAINTLGNHINRLDRRINKVGAGAAALAALHPDPNSDDDLSFAAGIGNYRGSTAAAIGAFYRPSDNVTVSMGATIGNGENMVNAGVTIGVGEGVGRNPTTRKTMEKEISQLKEANAAKDAEVRDLKKQVQTLQKQNEDTQEKLKRIMEKLGI
ncbi:YadA-like family protein [Megasphaera sp.]|uniref:YadA-like family protein n=1 Tax=Megasphaera sp. TaxID=2023260 RepID=UPI00352100D6